MRRAVRTVGFVLAFAAAGITTVNGLFALGHMAHPERLATKLMVMFAMPSYLKILRAHSLDPDTYSVAFMGDSTVVSYPKGQTVDARLQEALVSQWPGPGRVQVQSVSSLGMAPAGFFLVQDEINSAKPDIAIVTANLGWLRDPFPPRFQRPELAGWVKAERIYDTLVTLDLHKFGVTADRLLLYKLFVSTKHVGEWMLQVNHQAYLGYLREADACRCVLPGTVHTGEVGGLLTVPVVDLVHGPS